MKTAERAGRNVAVAVLATALLISLDRCRYGVDVADEAQYVGQALIPLIGGRPFYTDSLLQQSASLLLTPLLWLYREAAGSIDGVVFAARIWWCVAVVAAAWMLYRRFRGVVGDLNAGLCASLLVLFIPFGIPSLSYNSLGMIFLTMGLCDSRQIRGTQIGYLALAAFCYPTLATAPLLVLMAAIVAPETRSRAIRLGFQLLAVTVATIIGASLAFGWPALSDSYRLTASLGVFGFHAKIELWKWQLVQLFNGTPLVLVVMGVGAFLVAIRPRIAFLVLTASVLIGFMRVPIAYHWHYAIPFLAVAASPLTLRRGSCVRPELVATSLLCGGLTAWTSSNGLPTAVIGCFPAFLAGCLEWSRLGGIAFDTDRLIRWGRALATAAIGLWLAAGARSGIYFDQPIDELTATVSTGPYRGLRTTPARKDLMEALQSDVRRVTGETGSVLFLHGFPGGYLMTTMKPATRLLFMYPWNLPPQVRAIVLPQDPSDFPDWLVQIRSVPGKSFSGSGDEAVNAAFFESGTYRLALERTNYRIFHRVG